MMATTMATKHKIVPPERKPSGDIKPPVDSPTDFSPTFLKRMKDYIMPRVRDRRLGSQLGILHLAGALTETECAAGMLYARDVGQYERIKGFPARTARSPSFEAGFSGGGLDLDALKKMDPEVADKLEKKIKSQNKRIEKAYFRAQDAIPDSPAIARAIINDLCCNDLPIHTMHYEGVKAILRNLAKTCYAKKLGPVEAERPKKPRRAKADAAAIAGAAVDALDHWFTQRRGTVTSFSIVGATLIAEGHTAEGEVLGRRLSIKRSTIMVEAVIAQMLKAAESKGWKESKPLSAEIVVSDDAVRAGIKEKKA
jgi:hypothetical protein